jgi:alcohol dehydrogenase (NADP+)
MSTTPGTFATSRKCRCYAALTANGPLEPFTIDRRAVHETDVSIKILFAGICHSDIHQVKEEWGKTSFPMVPGHEICGTVEAVGSAVTKFKVGDIVGVGCMVDSCRKCSFCKAGEENYCSGGGMVGTYNSKAKYDHMPEHNKEGGEVTQGGYAESIVVDAEFVLHVPANLNLAAATPLLCAGITTYSPLKHFGLKPNHKLAVLGLGGLGHMAVKFGLAFGSDVTVISRGTSKKDSSLNDLKANHYIDSTDAAAMTAAAGTFDFMIDTIAADHDVGAMMALLTTNGKCVMVGAPSAPFSIHAFSFIGGRKTLSGSLIGGIDETQEMLDFCGRHNIVCDIEMIKASEINVAYDRAIKSDVKYRFVIDNSTI